MNKKEIRKDISKVRRLTAVVAILLLLLITMGLLFLKQQANNLKVEKTVFRLTAEKYKTIETTKQNLDDIEQVEEIVTTSLPSKENIIDFVKAVEEILSNTDNVNFKFRSKSPLKKNQFIYLPFSLNFHTSSLGFKEFLNQFNQLSYFTEIRDLEVKTFGGLKGDFDVKMTAWLYVAEPF